MHDNLIYNLIISCKQLYCIFPVNNYIVVGGGISDISSRIQVEQAYQSKGSFNISYVTELDGKGDIDESR